MTKADLGQSLLARLQAEQEQTFTVTAGDDSRTINAAAAVHAAKAGLIPRAAAEASSTDAEGLSPADLELLADPENARLFAERVRERSDEGRRQIQAMAERVAGKGGK